jgi:D-alanyl-D-alanine carboxypeptidase
MSGPTPSRSNARAPVPFAALVAALLVVVVVVVAVRAFGSGSSATARPSPGASTGPAASPSVSPSQVRQLEPLPACRYASLPAERTGYEDWRVTLVDPIYGLSRSYVPPGLVSTAEAGFEGGHSVRSVVIHDLAKLRVAALGAGHPLGIIAAYRSYQQQADLFEQRTAELGRAAALAKTARPGHSEHQLGTTLDFKTKGESDVTYTWAFSATGQWVEANAWRFGFIQSYPQQKPYVTCYPFEPWHFRYVGRKLAAKVHESGLTLREYLWQWDQEHQA